MWVIYFISLRKPIEVFCFTLSKPLFILAIILCYSMWFKMLHCCFMEIILRYVKYTFKNDYFKFLTSQTLAESLPTRGFLRPLYKLFFLSFPFSNLKHPWICFVPLLVYMFYNFAWIKIYSIFLFWLPSLTRCNDFEIYFSSVLILLYCYH